MEHGDKELSSVRVCCRRLLMSVIDAERPAAQHCKHSWADSLGGGLEENLGQQPEHCIDSAAAAVFSFF